MTNYSTVPRTEKEHKGEKKKKIFIKNEFPTWQPQATYLRHTTFWKQHRDDSLCYCCCKTLECGGFVKHILMHFNKKLQLNDKKLIFWVQNQEAVTTIKWILSFPYFVGKIPHCPLKWLMYLPWGQAHCREWISLSYQRENESAETTKTS